MPPSLVSRPRLTVFLTLLGLLLTVRGYRSLEGDQAYRLPILLRQQDPSLFRDDPFVRTFDDFNPHRGSLALIGLMSRPFGLSIGLVVLFGLTFLGTSFGVDRLARGASPDSGEAVGVVAVGLLLATLAGNIGTNHLFEPMVLDRQLAFALGWVALALSLGDTRRHLVGSAACLGSAAVVHPTVGLQLAMLLVAGRTVWLLRRRYTGTAFASTAFACLLVGLAILPGLVGNLKGSAHLFDGLDRETFRLLSVELQGPQHMLPHLWRLPQTLAWVCFPTLALVALASGRPEGGSRAPRARIVIFLVLNLLGLAMAWFGIEVIQNLRLTLFQPFRMATVARGLCLVFVADHVLRLWRRGGAFDRTRALLIPVGLTGDWSLVVVTAFEASSTVSDRLKDHPRVKRPLAAASTVVALSVFAGGLWFLARHDTESGHRRLIVAAAVGFGVASRIGKGRLTWTEGRRRRLLAGAWVVPLVAIAALAVPDRWFPGGRESRSSLCRRCRFGELPLDDLERLAVWCRRNTSVDALFVGPPGPKSFRLWAHRGLAFNRAGSPYNARGLADWARRFRDHVGFQGSDEALVGAYLRDRHGLEKGFDRMTAEGLAALADGQGAAYVIAAAPDRREPNRWLKAVHIEGRWAVYRRTGTPPVATRPTGLNPRR